MTQAAMGGQVQPGARQALALALISQIGRKQPNYAQLAALNQAPPVQPQQPTTSAISPGSSPTGGVAGLIATQARRYGLDPQAVLSVAAQEGLSGGIGDNGTSFGPFQLHYGGAYPSSAPHGAGASQAWATSPAGISYALSQIAGVAKGLHGRAAVENIVRRFERPANPDREVAGALAAYGHTESPGGPARGGASLTGAIAGLNPHFVQSLEQAVAAAGGTKIRVDSGYRSPGHNAAVGGVPHSNHMTGDAADGSAFVPGRGWLPLGVLLQTLAAKYGLRSGNVPGFYHGGRDPVHVDDGANMRHR